MAVIPSNRGRFASRHRPMRARRPRLRFRWWIAEIVLACVLAAWAIHSIDPAICWPQLLYILGVKRTQEYGKLAVLCLGMIGFLLIKRILSKRTK
jgi:hypothetical protein